MSFDSPDNDRPSHAAAQTERPGSRMLRYTCDDGGEGVKETVRVRRRRPAVRRLCAASHEVHRLQSPTRSLDRCRHHHRRRPSF